MRYRLYRNLFLIFLFCEILLTTSQRMRYMGPRENGLTVLILSGLMGLFAVLAAFEVAPPRVLQPQHLWENRLMKIVVALGIGMCIFHFFREIRVIPIDPRISDIIPTIQIMDRRLLGGEYPYALITELGYDLSPTYLPMMWLPFIPAALWHFDERWMAFLIWLTGALVLIWRAQKSNIRPEAKWLVTALPFFHFIIFEEGTDATFGNTVEMMIAGFYLLFATQLERINSLLAGNPRKSGMILGFFTMLCLLSRYSFLLWLPLCFAVVFFENRRLAIQTALWTGVGVLAVFIVPFMLKDPMIYFNGLKYYSAAALNEWARPGNDGHLYYGMGVAQIFRDEWGGEMAGRLSALQRWQFITSMAAVAFCAWIWWKKRSKLQYLPLFLLGSLKFYFAFFYGFIQMPYVYLQVTPCFLSIAVLLSFYAGDKVKRD
jgi:hypothetical protein